MQKGLNWIAGAAILMTLACTSASAKGPIPSKSLSISALSPFNLTSECQAKGVLDRGRTVLLEQTFIDQFDRPLDLINTWTPHYDGGYDWPVKRYLEGNAEQQIYVDPGYRGTNNKPLGLNPFSQKSGILTITGDKLPVDLQKYLYDRKFMSGMLTTRKALVQRHGYFEIRAKLPKGQGLWPAFWLLPNGATWPPEIDAFESLGHDPELISVTAHWKDQGTGPHRSSGCKVRVAGAASNFHTYGVLWESDQITYFIDRRAIGVMATPPGFDQPMHMIVNLAMGGNWGGMIDATTPLPARYEIDYVAAWNIRSAR